MRAVKYRNEVLRQQSSIRCCQMEFVAENQTTQGFVAFKRRISRNRGQDAIQAQDVNPGERRSIAVPRGKSLQFALLKLDMDRGQIDLILQDAQLPLHRFNL